MPDPASSAALPSTSLPIATDDDIAGFTQRLTGGDETAWGIFYERYRPRLIGYLGRLWNGERHALDDLLQDTLLRAVRHMRRFDSEEALWSWLTVLARSSVADAGRKRSSFTKFLQRFRRERPPEPWSRQPEDFVLALHGALGRLDAKSRRLIEEKYIERRSTRDLAQCHQLTEKAVERRLARARHRLARLLQTRDHQS